MERTGYEVYVAKISRCLDYERIEFSLLKMPEDNKHLFNVIKVFEKSGPLGTTQYIVDSVNVNQLRNLVNYSDKETVIRIR